MRTLLDLRAVSPCRSPEREASPLRVRLLRRLGARAVGLVTILLAVETAVAAAQPPDDPALLPFVGSDAVTVVDALTGHTEVRRGVIEEFVGDQIVLRRTGVGRQETIRLRHVLRLEFRRTRQYEEGLRLLSVGEWEAALASLDAAVIAEPRAWVQRETEAAAARALLALRRYDAVIERVERIVRQDPLTRHLHLLPLVWDERLPPEERLQAEPVDLQHQSALRRLCAASALLHDDRAGDAAAAELAELRVSGIAGVQELAETQLWRRTVLQDAPLRSGEFELWTARANALDPWLRGGPFAVLGRLAVRDHRYDDAAACLLWLPLMHPEDRPLAAAGLAGAARAQELAGRPDEARRLRAEAVDRFPDCSASRTLAEAASDRLEPPAENGPFQ